MEVILLTIQWQLAVVYLDNIFIFSETLEVHIKDTEVVSRLLKDACVTVKVYKHASFTHEIAYLGYIARHVILTVANLTVDAIPELKTPTTVAELRALIWLET